MVRSRNGFTLLEVLVAMGIFAIAMGSLPALLVTTVRANARASRITEATNIAQDKLEAIRNTAYAAVTSGSDAVTMGGSTTKSYSRSWNVTAGPTASTKNIAITVGWTDQQSDQIELDTVIGG